MCYPQHHPQSPHFIRYPPDQTFSEKPPSEYYASHRVASSIQTRDSVISHPFSPKLSSPSSPSSIASSVVKHHDRNSETEFGSDVVHVKVPYPPRARLDLEKQTYSPHTPISPTYASITDQDALTALYNRREGNDSLHMPNRQALKILFYLSGPCALLSLLITLWTLLSLAIAVLLQPLRLCSKRPPFRDQLIGFLAPCLDLQLRLIYSAHPRITYSAPLLLLIHVFSPVAAMGVAVASWTAACFWFFSAILGDPAGQDGHNDGRATVLGVRNWWDRWLSRALR
ncbi:hypothetical protein AOQ84DRAFT_289072 [Glonium stellatum]|uniref:Uncharacterized protein n=1 Tax=Glonium stellatum TaxID=574774 RepID=A0A8E2JVC1_9PEZI|nr:hypothetical protein AOQ84DRAFT_289072 [Glonium stellatum]